MCESFTFPNVPDCAHCHQQLGAYEMRWGTGLCNSCYRNCPKDCSVCNQRLPQKQLLWGSGLCNRCYDACDKCCRMCDKSLEFGEIRWQTGLCDECYNACDKVCRTCASELHIGQLRWGTGLCDPCYNSVQKNCKICEERIEDRQLRWNSGLCNQCYDVSEKFCHFCQGSMPLGSLHWRTGLCDPCYDKRSGVCKNCQTGINKGQARFGTGLCDSCYEALPNEAKLCQFCKGRITSAQLHWGTGLCLACYDKHGKQCKLCQKSIPFGQRRWGSGLCNDCYDGCERTCKICQIRLPLGQMHWGTRLCDPCYESCNKTCISCTSRIQIGELHWGTGVCDVCYDAKRQSKACGVCFGMKHKNKVFGRGVLAIIAAQFVFYAAPAALQPSLFLRIQELGYRPSPSAVFAAVLTAASVFSMFAPVPLGLWADYRGEREVYCGVTLMGGLSALVFLSETPAFMFALGWAALNLPPAVRGVRATYFAKHVAPEELSRASQLASSSGLLGGFVGPIASVLAGRAWGHGGPGRWLDGFTACAFFAVIAHVLLAGLLAWALTSSPSKAGDRSDSMRRRSSTRDASEVVISCDLCCKVLDAREREFPFQLCNGCYDTFGGEKISFKRYSRQVLMSFCVISMFLEISMNAGVVATFQPIAVDHFGWGNDAIAAVNFVGTGLSFVVSLVFAWLRLPERTQMALAAGMYFFGVTMYSVPPLAEWRAVVGLMVGIKAQILFMAPFTAICSRLIGRARMTNRLATALCLAPAIGAALGTTMAPLFVAVAGTPLFSLASVPAAVAVGCIAWGWSRFQGVPKPARSAHLYAPGED
uniref:Uncharacterized protein n=1 Tax=Zooxanthella nutricula TaxID=1333877 RepID=A0A7S2PLK3_9DINO